MTRLIVPSFGLTSDDQNLRRLLDEAESHMLQAQEYYANALSAHSQDAAWLFIMAKAQIESQAAIMCQQQAGLLLGIHTSNTLLTALGLAGEAQAPERGPVA